MTLIVTQNGTVYNISDFRFITVENTIKDENDNLPNYCIVVNKTYIIGYYNTEEQAIRAVTWIANKIGESFNVNTSIVMPTIEAIDELLAIEKTKSPCVVVDEIEVINNDNTIDA